MRKKSLSRLIGVVVSVLFLFGIRFFSTQTGVTTKFFSTATNSRTVYAAAVPGKTGTGDTSSSPLYAVAKVVDGDTIDVIIDGTNQRVRLIGINTPETVDPRRPVQCFGREASDEAKRVLTGKSVHLEADASQDDIDKYGRSLRYVVLDDGTNFNEMMIREGYAYEDTYRVPYKYQIAFKAAQKEASSAKRGLWAAETCNGALTAVK